MKVNIHIDNEAFSADLSQPFDLSIPLKNGDENPTAWYCGPVSFAPVKANGFVGSVAEGGSVNFRDVFFNPHGHGTHTECVGHISKEEIAIFDHLKEFFFISLVISVKPEVTSKGDQVISESQILPFLNQIRQVKALIIRTLPNKKTKKTQQYSNTNPAYVSAAAMRLITEAGIDHFLIDLPSVDREADEGKLAAHHIFWNYPENPRLHATITEFIYVPDEVEDGLYLLNLQTAPFYNDATPSRPVVFKLNK